MSAQVVSRFGWIGAPGRADAGHPLMVVLHGFGANESDLMAALPVVSLLLPGVQARVMSVRGFFPVNFRQHGYSWFPGSVFEQPPAEAIAESADRLSDAVTEECDQAVWLGFSQGMCAAVTVMRRRPELVTGLIALSGFSFAASQPGDADLARRAREGSGLPAFYGRDPADPVVPGYASAWALQYLRDHTALTERSYPGLGHSLSMPEIADVVAFLRPLLAAGTAAA